MSSTDAISDAVANTSLDKIHLYTSAEDTEGKALSDGLNVQHIARNSWNQPGAFINFTEIDTTYGGHQVYKVMIEKGCEIYVDTNTVYVVDQDYTFYNNDFGDSTKKLGAVEHWVRGNTKTEISLTGVQMKSNGADFGGGWYQFLVLQSDAFNNMEFKDSIENAKENTTLSKIRLYTSEDDSTGTALSNLEKGVSHIGRQSDVFTGVKGLFINYPEYGTSYGGDQVYKVTIEKGCELYVDDYTVYVVDQDYTYLNNDFGNSTKKLNAENWVRAKQVSLTGIQLRSAYNDYTMDAWYHYMVLIADEYTGLKYVDTFGDDGLNNSSFDKIRLYTSADDTGALLSTLGVNHIGRNFLAQPGAVIAYDKYRDGYNGSQVYKVVIEEGCRFYADADTKTVFVVDKDYTYYNDKYGVDSAKTDACSWTRGYTAADVTCCADNGGSYSVTYDSTTIDGVSYASGAAFTGARGIYKLQYKNEGSIYDTRLIVWKQADVDEVDGVDVRDLVSLLKGVKGTTTFTEYGKLGADMDGSGTVDNSDAASVRKFLVGNYNYSPDAQF